MKVIIWLCFIALLFFFQLASTIAFAQSDPTLSSDSIHSFLPSPHDTDRKVMLTKDNVESFKDLLIEPLMQWIQDGLFVARLYSDLGFVWQLSKKWQEQSVKNGRNFSLNDNLTPEPSVPENISLGFPFGLASEIEKEKDSIKKAYKILWNVTYVQGASQDILYDLQISWLHPQAVSRQTKGVFFKRYFFNPHFEDQENIKSSEESSLSQDSSSSAIEVKQPSVAAINRNSSEEKVWAASGDIFSKEMLQLTFPAVVFGYAQIFWRMRNVDEDQGWIYSPVVGRSRKVLASNRSDSLLGGSLTSDDFWVFGSKVQSVRAEVVDSKELLMPFPSLSYFVSSMEEGLGASGAIVSQEKEASTSSSSSSVSSVHMNEKILAIRGYNQRADGSSSTVIWNFENKQFIDKVFWLPLTAIWVPRRVWVIETYPKDPYYRTGREILFIDQESMLPLCKIVYDFYGNYQRVVFAAWGLANTKDIDLRFPFAAFVLAVNQSDKQATVVSTDYVRTFRGEDTENSKKLASLLDIKQHGSKTGTKTEEKGKSSSSSNAKTKGKSSSSQISTTESTDTSSQEVVDE